MEGLRVLLSCHDQIPDEGWVAALTSLLGRFHVIWEVFMATCPALPSFVRPWRKGCIGNHPS